MGGGRSSKGFFGEGLEGSWSFNTNSDFILYMVAEEKRAIPEAVKSGNVFFPISLMSVVRR